ncbi:MAG: hydrolase 1, exosortase A system-associated [Rhodoferax sp.]|nr:hydrolase 1, exosortase A system-associated [Rhodoferax sp.]
MSFPCQEESLLGVLSTPAEAANATGTAVVIVVGGPQYRAGSHRQFVLLARALAACGHAVLRFDFRGMGDSSGNQRSFEHLSMDIGAAITALCTACPGVGKVVLWGLCDGASAALMYLDDTGDERVGGLCLVNPWLRTDASLARTHLKHYYLQRLGQADFWRKLAGGGVALTAARGLLGAVRQTLSSPRSTATTSDAPQALPFQQRMSLAFRRFDGPMLVLLSEKDHTAQEFAGTTAADRTWRRAMARANVTKIKLANADHTLSDPVARGMLESTCADWLQRLKRPAAAQAQQH